MYLFLFVYVFGKLLNCGAAHGPGAVFGFPPPGHLMPGPLSGPGFPAFHAPPSFPGVGPFLHSPHEPFLQHHQRPRPRPHVVTRPPLRPFERRTSRPGSSEHPRRLLILRQRHMRNKAAARAVPMDRRGSLSGSVGSISGRVTRPINPGVPNVRSRTQSQGQGGMRDIQVDRIHRIPDSGGRRSFRRRGQEIGGARTRTMIPNGAGRRSGQPRHAFGDGAFAPRRRGGFSGNNVPLPSTVGMDNAQRSLQFQEPGLREVVGIGSVSRPIQNEIQRSRMGNEQSRMGIERSRIGNERSGMGNERRRMGNERRPLTGRTLDFTTIDGSNDITMRDNKNLNNINENGQSSRTLINNKNDVRKMANNDKVISVKLINSNPGFGGRTVDLTNLKSDRSANVNVQNGPFQKIKDTNMNPTSVGLSIDSVGTNNADVTGYVPPKVLMPDKVLPPKVLIPDKVLPPKVLMPDKVLPGSPIKHIVKSESNDGGAINVLQIGNDMAPSGLNPNNVEIGSLNPPGFNLDTIVADRDFTNSDATMTVVVEPTVNKDVVNNMPVSDITVDTFVKGNQGSIVPINSGKEMVKEAQIVDVYNDLPVSPEAPSKNPMDVMDITNSGMVKESTGAKDTVIDMTASGAFVSGSLVDIGQANNIDNHNNINTNEAASTATIDMTASGAFIPGSLVDIGKANNIDNHNNINTNEAASTATIDMTASGAFIPGSLVDIGHVSSTGNDHNIQNDNKNEASSSAAIDLTASGAFIPGSLADIGQVDVVTLDIDQFADLEKAIKSGKPISADILQSIIGSVGSQTSQTTQTQMSNVVESADTQVIIIDSHSGAVSTDLLPGTLLHSPELPLAPLKPNMTKQGPHNIAKAENVLTGMHHTGHEVVGIVGDSVGSIAVGNSNDILGLFTAHPGTDFPNVPASVSSIPASIGKMMPLGKLEKQTKTDKSKTGKPLVSKGQ